MFEIYMLLAIGTAAVAAGPAAPSPVPDALVRDLVRLREAALGSDYALSQVAWMSNGIGPRLSGSRGAEASVEYVAAEMARQGFTVRKEKVMVPHWVRGEESGEHADRVAGNQGHHESPMFYGRARRPR